MVDVTNPHYDREMQEGADHMLAHTRYSRKRPFLMFCGVNTHDPAKREATKETLEALAKSLGSEYVEVDDAVPDGGIKEMFRDFVVKVLERCDPEANMND